MQEQAEGEEYGHYRARLEADSLGLTGKGDAEAFLDRMKFIAAYAAGYKQAEEDLY